MQTRSQARKNKPELFIEIDFDEASTAWRSNKNSLKNGCYSYICGYTLRTGGLCERCPIDGSDYCIRHN